MNSRQSARRAPVLAIRAGAIAAFGQAPYDVPVLMLVGMAAAVALFVRVRRPARAAWIGWCFGLGYFAHTLQWIVSPFLVDVARHGWMAPFALVLLAAGMALFWGAAFWAARRLAGGRRAWALILTWPAAEMVRAYLFTGFPWGTPAQATVGVLAGQSLAWAGPYGLTLWMVAVAALLPLLRLGPVWRRAAGAAVGVFAAAVLIVPPRASPVADDRPVLRLVQPNAAQRDKWNAEMIPVFFRRQLDFTAAPAEGRAPDLVIWSETAIPWTLDYAEGALVEIARAGGETPVALGVQRSDGLRYFNSMVVLDPQGGVVQTYDKHHLVPFGEYMPLGDLMSRFGIRGLAAQFGNGYAAGPGARLLDFGPLGQALPLICYEAVFAHDVGAAPTRPAFLIQITNDAWFGRGAGPKQHLAQARMRAIEQGLPLARAANTGISAMIDPNGRIVASLPLNTAGFLDAPLPAPLPPTLYSRTGDLPLAVFLTLALAVAAGVKRFWR